jgi:ubiquinone/menaquinone biosynthesis C-methylase UbiE
MKINDPKDICSNEIINHWDKYWQAGDPGDLYHKDITERVLKLTNSLNDVVVEIGSGHGVDAIEIASTGRAVIALDLSREALKLMKGKVKTNNVIPVLADALALPFKNASINLIYHQGVMEHFRDPNEFLKEQYRCLLNNGIIIIDVPQTFTFYTIKKKWAMWRNKWFAGWESQYSPRRLYRVLNSNGFRITEIYGREYDLSLLIWIRDIETLGKRRFGHPIVPAVLGRPIGRIWRFWEKRKISNYIRLCVGAVAIKEISAKPEKVRT